MINKKDFKAGVMAAIERNGGNCSVCNQSIDDISGQSFAKMRDIKASWGRKELRLFVPNEITFTVPYADIIDYNIMPDYKHIGIVLKGRRLVSIRVCNA